MVAACVACGSKETADVIGVTMGVEQHCRPKFLLLEKLQDALRLETGIYDEGIATPGPPNDVGVLRKRL